MLADQYTLKSFYNPTVEKGAITWYQYTLVGYVLTAAVGWHVGGIYCAGWLSGVFSGFAEIGFYALLAVTIALVAPSCVSGSLPKVCNRIPT